MGSNPERGLTGSEAKSRITLYGLNELAEAKRASSWKLLLAQFKETLILILIAAAIISIVVGEALDSAVILAIVFASAGLGFYQEYRAEQSLALLKKLAAPAATIVRDGQTIVVPARELVPGDLFFSTRAIRFRPMRE